MTKRFLGPSPIFYGIKKIHICLFLCGGSEKDNYVSDERSFEIMAEQTSGKLRRLNNK
jgi:hypothetical protein